MLIWHLRGVFALIASITLEVKTLCSCYNTRKGLFNCVHFEQSHWNWIFCSMYGLAVMQSIPRQTTGKNINNIPFSIIIPSGIWPIFNKWSFNFPFLVLLLAARKMIKVIVYSCNRTTMTWIQISRQNWNSFFSNARHQIMI